MWDEIRGELELPRRFSSNLWNFGEVVAERKGFELTVRFEWPSEMMRSWTLRLTIGGLERLDR
jgi:hypothetical protein